MGLASSKQHDPEVSRHGSSDSSSFPKGLSQDANDLIDFKKKPKKPTDKEKNAETLTRDSNFDLPMDTWAPRINSCHVITDNGTLLKHGSEENVG